jgi:hypothetical protein
MSFSAEVQDWLREHALLCKRTAALEKDAGTFYLARTDLKEDAAALQEQERQDSLARAEECAKIRKQLSVRRALLRRVQDRVEALASGTAVADDLQSLMEQLEDLLREFRRSMRSEFDALSTDERALARELQAVAARFEDWSKPGNNSSTAQQDDASSSSATAAKPSQRAHTAFTADTTGTEEYVTAKLNAMIAAEGGPTGGWPQHQHDTFLRLWTQINQGFAMPNYSPPDPPQIRRARVAELVSRAATTLVERSSDEVESHFAWYERFAEYTREKRRLVGQWKARKAQEKLHRQETETAEAVTTEADVLQRQQQAAKAAAEREKRRLSVLQWREAKEHTDDEQSQSAATEAEAARFQVHTMHWHLIKRIFSKDADAVRSRCRCCEIP